MKSPRSAILCWEQHWMKVLWDRTSYNSADAFHSRCGVREAMRHFGGGGREMRRAKKEKDLYVYPYGTRHIMTHLF